MKIVFLGTAGWHPSDAGNRTPCVHIPDYNVIFDAGTGLANPEYLKKMKEDPKGIHLFLSHTHIDHVSGMPALRIYLPKEIPSVTIYAPEEQLINVAGIFGEGYPFNEDQVNGLSIVKAPGDAKALRHVDIPRAKVFSQTFSHIEDGSPVAGYKLISDDSRKALVYLVDVAPTKSGPTQEVIDFVKTPSIEKLALICDCYSMAGHRMTIRDKVGGEFISTPYSSPLTVSELIKRAGVNQAWLIHPSAQLKRIKFDDMLLEVKKRVGDSIQVSMPKDGEEVEF